MDTTVKPVLELSGGDGNAFVLMGKAQRAAKKAGWTQQQIDAVMKEARSGDYDHLLQTLMKHFEVE